MLSKLKLFILALREAEAGESLGLGQLGLQERPCLKTKQEERKSRCTCVKL